MSQDKFPALLNKPWRILFFEGDEVMIMGGVYILAYLFSYWLLFAIIPVLAIYKTVKAKNPRGYIKQVGYISGLLDLKGYPSSFTRSFDE